VVSTLTEHDLSEVYTVREALDATASRLVIASASDEGLRSLEIHLDALDGPPPPGGSPAGKKRATSR